MKTIGILGGMGPAATALLYRYIVQMTAAERDSDHIPAVIYSLPQIPDRTAHILGSGPSPLPLIKTGFEVLERTPASFVVIPCNTVYYYYPRFAEMTSLPVVHIMKAIQAAIPGDKSLHRLGILATEGTRRARIFDAYFSRQLEELIYPSPAMQAALMEAICAIKAGQCGAAPVRQAAQELLDKGAERIILGCTELSLIYADFCDDFPFIDSTRSLARAAVEIAGGREDISNYLLEPAAH